MPGGFCATCGKFSLQLYLDVLGRWICYDCRPTRDD